MLLEPGDILLQTSGAHFKVREVEYDSKYQCFRVILNQIDLPDKPADPHDEIVDQEDGFLGEGRWRDTRRFRSRVIQLLEMIAGVRK